MIMSNLFQGRQLSKVAIFMKRPRQTDQNIAHVAFLSKDHLVGRKEHEDGRETKERQSLLAKAFKANCETLM